MNLPNIKEIREISDTKASRIALENYTKANASIIENDESKKKKEKEERQRLKKLTEDWLAQINIEIKNAANNGSNIAYFVIESWDSRTRQYNPYELDASYYSSHHKNEVAIVNVLSTLYSSGYDADVVVKSQEIDNGGSINPLKRWKIISFVFQIEW